MIIARLPVVLISSRSSERGQAGIRADLLVNKFYGQATKGMRWMPWRRKAMKDAAGCDKLR